MIKGAVIFSVGLAVGGFFGLIEGFNLARSMQNVAIDKVTTNKAA